MTEAAAIVVALFSGGILGALAVKVYSRADEWQMRVRSVSLMYRLAK
jgi:hypothetical protein